MRIGLIAPLVSPIAQPYIGGAQALLADLARGLQVRGHEITLFARSGSLLPGVKIESIEVPASVRPANFAEADTSGKTDPGFFDQANLFLRLFLQLQRRASEFDLLHIHAFDWPAYTCSTLVHALPVLHTLHLPAVSSEINEALRVLDQQGHPLTLLTVSQACAQTYAPYTRIDHVVYNGLDITAIPFQARVEPEAPLLFAGRISPEKGVEAAIDIAELAGKPLVIAGGIYDAHYYEQRIKPRLERPGNHITYMGQIAREAIWQLMSQASGLLCPIAWDEPFGLTPVEAMATGTPVIAFQRGAMSEIIQQDQTGFLVKPGDCQTAAALVARLPELSRAHCRLHVEKHFTLDAMLSEHERIYQQVSAHTS
jgi:glycosyltransferase involved in cell wall biosynthesis